MRTDSERFFPLIQNEPTGLDRSPLFPCYNEKRMRRHDSYLRELSWNRYLLQSKTFIEPKKVPSLRIHCPFCGSVMYTSNCYSPIVFKCTRCEDESHY